eukprot:TRINITY_DN6058_c0_g1_i1.p1 TRINITY_DN6058_c0_g1~~TRINITY_DN6058_c0_g1_i1.p1  ORF type:complete len:357 (-),score=57.49 TRINITY_DN6058_c0_g1_i1:986-2056(-)
MIKNIVHQIGVGRYACHHQKLLVHPIISGFRFFSDDIDKGKEDGQEEDETNKDEKLKDFVIQPQSEMQDHNSLVDQYSQTKKVVENEFGMDDDESTVRSLQGEEQLHKEEDDDVEDEEEEEFNDAAGYREANLSKEDVSHNIMQDVGYARRLRRQAIREAAQAREMQKQDVQEDTEREPSEKEKLDLTQFSEYEKRLGKIAVQLQREKDSLASAVQFDKLIKFQGLLSPDFLEYQEKKRLAGAEKFYMQLIDIKMVCKMTKGWNLSLQCDGGSGQFEGCGGIRVGEKCRAEQCSCQSHQISYKRSQICSAVQRTYYLLACQCQFLKRKATNVSSRARIWIGSSPDFHGNMRVDWCT